MYEAVGGGMYEAVGGGMEEKMEKGWVKRRAGMDWYRSWVARADCLGVKAGRSFWLEAGAW